MLRRRIITVSITGASGAIYAQTLLRLLDADRDRLEVGDVQCFEMEALMDEEIETHHSETSQVAAAFQTMADGMPALGIVAAIAGMAVRPRRVIAFAAEGTDHVEHARAKLQGKGVDAIFANDIGNMGSMDAGGWWIDQRRAEPMTQVPKAELAEALIQSIREIDA